MARSWISTDAPSKAPTAKPMSWRPTSKASPSWAGPATSATTTSMSSNSRPDAILRQALRGQVRSERFGGDARCECCGTSTLAHLNRVDGHTVCACCRLLAQGRDVLETHHLAGGHTGPTVLVCGNCHAELSDCQRDWRTGLSFDER